MTISDLRKLQGWKKKEVYFYFLARLWPEPIVPFLLLLFFVLFFVFLTQFSDIRFPLYISCGSHCGSSRNSLRCTDNSWQNIYILFNSQNHEILHCSSGSACVSSSNLFW